MLSPVSSPEIAPTSASKVRRRLDLASELRIVTQRLVRRIRSEADPAGLTEAQYSVLATLRRRGPMTPRQLAELDGVQPPTMTRTLGLLESRELISRVPHPTDGRRVVIDLTEDGVGVVRETVQRRTAWVARQLAGLTREERATLREATRILRELVDG